MSNRNRNACGDNSPYTLEYRRWVAELHAVRGLPIRQIAQQEDLSPHLVAGWHGAYKDGHYDRAAPAPQLPPRPDCRPAPGRYASVYPVPEAVKPAVRQDAAPAVTSDGPAKADTQQHPVPSSNALVPTATIQTPQGTITVPADPGLIRQIMGIK